MRLAGKGVLITGCGSGVGLAAVRQFAAAGARVVATVQHEADLAAVAMPGVAVATVLDVTDEAAWQRALAEADAAGCPIDVLFNNAGATIRGDIEATDRALWEQTLAVNLTSVFLGCRAVVPAMKRRRSGSIVNNASINGLRGNTGLIAYSASKGGVVALTRSLALDLAPFGIRVNCLCPAAIDTRMTRDYLAGVPDPAAVERAIIDKHPLGRMATAEEVAAVAVFLASPAASFLTGTAIPVDGGRSIR